MIRKMMLFALGLGLLATPATAQTEIEVDPIAYALNGYSLHIARVLGSTRLDVGVFGADVPKAFHGNDGWSSSIRGAGIKWDYVGSDSDGLFVGLDGGYMRNKYTWEAADQSAERDVVGLGVRGGYRLPIGRSGLYLAPWVGVSYNLAGDDVQLDGERFDRNPVEVFPTIHIGWRF